jgi:hypothetical protein
MKKILKNKPIKVLFYLFSSVLSIVYAHDTWVKSSLIDICSQNIETIVNTQRGIIDKAILKYHPRARGCFNSYFENTTVDFFNFRYSNKLTLANTDSYIKKKETLKKIFNIDENLKYKYIKTIEKLLYVKKKNFSNFLDLKQSEIKNELINNRCIKGLEELQFLRKQYVEYLQRSFSFGTTESEFLNYISDKLYPEKIDLSLHDNVESCAKKQDRFEYNDRMWKESFSYIENGLVNKQMQLKLYNSYGQKISSPIIANKAREIESIYNKQYGCYQQLKKVSCR